MMVKMCGVDHVVAISTVERRSVGGRYGYDAVIEETELSYQFTIAILADPHISGTPEHTARLEEAVI